MSKEVTISVVLGSYNRLPFLKTVIERVRQEVASIASEMIVVDGGSSDGSAQWLLKQRDIVTIVQHNRGMWKGREIARRSWGYFMNLAFKAASGKYILMISDDALLVRGAVRNGIEFVEGLAASGRRVGAVPFYWRDWPDYEHQPYSVFLTLGGNAIVNHGIYVRDALQSVGWIEEDRYAFYYADSDVCLKMWSAGYEVVECPTSFVEHFAHANESVRATNNSKVDRDRQAFLDRWSAEYGSFEAMAADRKQLAYDDPDRTVELFPKAPVAWFRFRRWGVSWRRRCVGW